MPFPLPFIYLSMSDDGLMTQWQRDMQHLPQCKTAPQYHRYCCSCPVGKYQLLHWVLVQEGTSCSVETCYVFVDIPAVHRDLQNNWIIAHAICVFTYMLVSTPYGNADSFKAFYHPIPTAEKSMESKVLSGFIYIIHVLCSGKDNIVRLWSQHFACYFPGEYFNWRFRIESPMSSLGCLMMNSVKLGGKVEETAGAWCHLKIAQDQN